MKGARYPAFPVKMVGFQELHAAFLNESRTRGALWDRVQEIRVSARFWQMWDSTALDLPLSLLQRIPRSMIIYTINSQRPRSAESHICQNRADMGHPSFVTGTERQV